MGAADSYFQKAELALKKHNFDYAIELFLQGLAIDPKATAQRKRLHQIETLAIQERGGNPSGGFANKFKTASSEMQARKFHLQKKYDEEVLEIEKILRLQPMNVGTLSMLAQALENIEIYEGAISCYEEITSTDKLNIEAFRRMGKLYEKLGDVERSIASWERVKMYKPEDKEAGKAIRDLSAAQMVKKSEDKKKAAGDDSFRAMLKDSTEAEDLQKKQQIIRTDEDRRRAIKFKIEDIKKDPTNSRHWRDLGTLFQDLKHWDKAEEAYRKALEVNPQDLYAQEKIGHLKELRLDTELDDLRKQAGEAGSGADSELAGKIAKKEDEFLIFRRDEYLRRVNAHPTDYELKVKYGIILRECKQYDDAIGQFQKSVKDPKLKIISHTQIGHCFVAKALHELAIGQFQLGINGVSDHDSEIGKDIRYALADAFERKGDAESDPEKKKADYRQAIDLFQLIMSVDISYRDVSARVDQLRQKVAQVP